MLEEAFGRLVTFLMQLGWPGLLVVLAAGLAVAFAGYRIRLVFFFVVGFYVTAVIIGPLFAALIDAPETAVVFGVIAGFIGGAVAVRLYFVALFLVGLLAGASLLVTAVGSMVPDLQAALIVAAAIGGVVGGIAAIALDRIAVIAASAWVGGLHAAAVGATGMHRVLALSYSAAYSLFLGILVVITLLGVLYQLRVFPSARRQRYERSRRP